MNYIEEKKQNQKVIETPVVYVIMSKVTITHVRYSIS